MSNRNEKANAVATLLAAAVSHGACSLREAEHIAAVEGTTMALCKKHPKYKALRKPTSKCKECTDIWKWKSSKNAT